MQTCLFCRNTNIFKIDEYGSNGHSVRKDMIMFFGYQIEGDLRPEDALCKLCMNIMRNVAELKRRLLPLISRSEGRTKPISFGEEWDIFAKMTFNEVLESRTRTPTPNNLLTCYKTVNYESPYERKFEQLERQRSRSVTSLRSTMSVNTEVMDAMGRKRTKRRRRGFGWTRRKKGKYSDIPESATERKQSYSCYSRTFNISSRPNSRLSVQSTESYESFYPPSLERTSPVVVSPKPSNTLRYVNGCLQNKRTRSVSKLLEEVVDTPSKEEDDFLACTECDFVCEEVDVLAEHKVNIHNNLKLFWCNFCDKKYTSNFELKVHMKTHPQFPCVICHKEFYSKKDLLEHWQGHFEKAVPCKVCGKRFHNQDRCNNHIKNVHRKKSPIRVDFKKNERQTEAQRGDFQVRVLLQDAVASFI